MALSKNARTVVHTLLWAVVPCGMVFYKIMPAWLCVAWGLACLGLVGMAARSSIAALLRRRGSGVQAAQGGGEE